MSEPELPLATPSLEERVRQMVEDGLSPEEYAARWAHSIGTFSLDGYRYRDPNLESWIHALGAILFQKPGAPTIEDLRQRFLTSEEREAIRKRSREEF